MALGFKSAVLGPTITTATTFKRPGGIVVPCDAVLITTAPAAGSFVLTTPEGTAITFAATVPIATILPGPWASVTTPNSGGFTPIYSGGL